MPHAAFRPFVLLLLLGLCSFAALRAQSIAWDPDEGELPVGMTAGLSLVFKDCEPKSPPKIPPTPGLTLEYRGTSQQTTMVNFSVSRSIVYSYAARLEGNRAVTIPAFEIETNQGRLKVPAARFTPGEARVGAQQVPVAKIASSRLIPAAPTVWAGEVFGLTYQLSVNLDHRAELASNPDWTPAPVVAEDLGKGQRLPARGAQDTQAHVAYRTRGYIKDAGTHQLNPVTQLLNVQTSTGMSLFGLVPQMEQLAITSDRPRITVRPLPAPAPADFSGAVGQFKLESKIVPEKATVGDPITWTLTLSGTGNWPEIGGLPAREVSKAFQVIQPQSKRAMAEGQLFTGTLTEDVVLMPTQPGTYTLGELRFVVFDPQTGSYQTLTTPKTTLTIGAAPASAFPSLSADPQATAPATPAAANATGSGTPAPAGSAAAPASRPPAEPAAIPGDLLPTQAPSAAPLSPRTWFALLLSPGLLLLSLWLVLAYRRARRLDPQAPRRAAHLRLQSTLQQLTRLARLDAAAGTPPASDPASATARHRLLAAWQTDTAQLWQLGAAAPNPTDLLRAPPIPGSLAARSTLAPSPMAEATAQLWREADHTLYGASTPLPADWIDRALQSWEQTRPGSFSWFTLFRPRHCLPWLFSALLLLCADPLTASAQAATAPARQDSSAARSPEALYRQGDFSAAQQAWVTHLRDHPLDWSTRTNLGLTLLQKGEPGAAVAHLAVAWVQQPRHPEVQRAFQLALARVDTAPAVLGPLQQPGPLNSLVRLASPREWQLILVAAATLLAGALATLLLAGFGIGQRRLSLLVSTALLLSALGLGASATVALRAYGDAADERAVLVWSNSQLRSIPTEADTTQETTALPAGSLALVDRSFLGWLRVAFPSGQTGWVRREDVVALWR